MCSFSSEQASKQIGRLFCLPSGKCSNNSVLLTPRNLKNNHVHLASDRVFGSVALGIDGFHRLPVPTQQPGTHRNPPCHPACPLYASVYTHRYDPNCKRPSNRHCTSQHSCTSDEGIPGLSAGGRPGLWFF